VVELALNHTVRGLLDLFPVVKQTNHKINFGETSFIWLLDCQSSCFASCVRLKGLRLNSVLQDCVTRRDCCTWFGNSNSRTNDYYLNNFTHQIIIAMVCDFRFNQLTHFQIITFHQYHSIHLGCLSLASAQKITIALFRFSIN
jgi:hypothetical protein